MGRSVMSVATRVEARRGCGYRKEGGLYLVGDAFGDSCHRLPFELHVCPTCGRGVRRSRAWTWIDGIKLFVPVCEVAPHCSACVVCSPYLLLPTDEVKEGEERPNRGKSGLIWVGEKYYRFPETFIAEANRMQISRRIKAVPQGFVLGETWVFLAHVKAIFSREDGKVTYTPGIFRAYRPTGIEYVVKGDETDEDLEKMVKRGITPVKVEKEDITSDMDFELPEEGHLSVEHDGDLMPGTTSPDSRHDIVDKTIKSDLPVYEIPLSRRACKSLEAHGLKNAKELLSMTRSDLLKIPGIGKALAAEIVKQLGLEDK